MIIALLGLLGVPLWLLLGWVAAGIWHRHDVKQNLLDLFKMKIRAVKGPILSNSSEPISLLKNHEDPKGMVKDVR
jgi:hypothetical protein